MSTPLDVFTTRPARTDTETFPVDPGDVDRLAELKEKRDKARRQSERSPEDASLLEAYEDADDAYNSFKGEIRTITFHIRAIGDKRVEELMIAYPASKEQKARARKEANGNPAAEPSFDEDKFAPALLAESIVKIVDSHNPDTPQTDVTLDQMTAMWNAPHALSTSDRVTLFTKAMLINQKPSSIEDLGKD